MEVLLGFQDELLNSPLFTLMQGPLVLLSIVTAVGGGIIIGMGLFARHRNKKIEKEAKL